MLNMVEIVSGNFFDTEFYHFACIYHKQAHMRRRNIWLLKYVFLCHT